MTVRTVLIGAGGQLGTALQARLPGDLITPSRRELDVTSREQIEAVLESARADRVINAAAYNLVDRAEQEPDVAFAVNALGPRNLAQACAAREIPLLHVSTDFVFSGREGTGPEAPLRETPYTEDDLPQPQSAYAVSKLAGEYFVRAECPRHFVVRTCGLFGRTPAPQKPNFVESMLRLGAERDELRIVADQRCCPTAVSDLAESLVALLETEAYGLYHGTGDGSASWYEFASEIIRLAGLTTKVTPITSAEFAAPAQRPVWSVLDSSRLSDCVGFPIRSWRESLPEYLASR